MTLQSNYLFSAISGGMCFFLLGKVMYNEPLSFLTMNAFCVCLFYPVRYHKSQAIYLESKDNTKISCVISSVGTNEVSFTSRPALFITVNM